MISRLNALVSLFGVSLLFVLMMITVLDVVGRSVLNKPLPGANELTEIVLAGMVFVLLPRICFRRGHIAVDLASRVFGRRVLVAMDAVAAIAGFVVFALIGWRLWHLAVTAGKYGDATATLGVPLAAVLYLIAVLAWVSAVACLLTTMRPPGNPPVPGSGPIQ